MRRPGNDAADTHFARQFGIERIGDVVLLEIAGAPAGDVEELVIHGEVDIGDQRRTGLEALEHGWQVILARGLGRDLDHLLDGPLVAVAIPGPDRRREVLQADDTVDEPIGLGRIVCGPQLEDELVLVAEIDGLHVLALVQIPEMQPTPVLGAQQHLGDQAVLESIRRTPFAGHHRVVSEMPPGIIGEVLRSTVHFPLASDVEALVIHQEDAARPLAFSIAEGGDVDALGPAMDGVRSRIARFVGDLLGFDHLDDRGLARIGLGVEDVNARGAQARHDQIAPLHVRMWRVGAQARRAGVPSEMMQLVADIGHRRIADDGRVACGAGVDVDDGYRVRNLSVGIEGCDIGQRFRFGLHRHSW